MTLFNDNNDQLNLDPSKNYLEELVGENKKFKDVQALAYGKAEADAYVETLKKRLDEMRADYTRLDETYKTGASLQEIVDQLKTKFTSSDDTDANGTTNQDTKPNISQDDIASIVTAKLQEHETARRQQENERMVAAKLRERFGPNYQEHLKAQTQSLGLTQQFVDDLAKNYPEVLFRTIGLDQPAKSDPPVLTSSSKTPFAPTNTKRTWSYYQKLKQTDPKLYHDPKTTIQMHKDAQALGEEFMDGDFNAI